MNKSIVLKVETQTQEGEVLSLCFINENTIALETSEIARKMFTLNRALFDEINTSTRMLGGSLYREEIMRSKFGTNSLLVPIKDRFESNEKEISQLFFENNILRRQQRAITPSGKKIDFDPENITADDLLDMKMVCSVEEISLFEDIGVKTIMITDSLRERRSLLNVAYRIELSVDTDFKEYLDLVLERLSNSVRFLTQYLSNINNGSHYDSHILNFKEEFSTRVLSSIGINSDSTRLNLASNRVKNSEFGQAKQWKQ